MKNVKFWTILGILSLGITCSIAYSSTSKASSGLQSKGKLVYQDPVSQQEIIMDANDHTILKGSIDANSGQILSLKEFQAQQETLNQEMQNKDTELENGIQSINDSLTANSTQFYFDYQNGKYGYNTDPSRGADTFSPFSNGLEFQVFLDVITNTEKTFTVDGEIKFVSIAYPQTEGRGYYDSNKSTTSWYDFEGVEKIIGNPSDVISALRIVSVTGNTLTMIRNQATTTRTFVIIGYSPS